jgi:hypothetical protein
VRTTLEALAQFPERVGLLFDSIPQELWHRAPRSWEGIPSERLTPVEQACHLRDIEIEGYRVRFERTLREETPELPDLPGEVMARERHYATQDPRVALREFTLARAANVELLRSLSPEALSRNAIFENKVTSLAGLIHFLASHDNQHLSGLEWLLARAHQIDDPGSEL